jgi:hypothetical protein
LGEEEGRARLATYKSLFANLPYGPFRALELIVGRKGAIRLAQNGECATARGTQEPIPVTLSLPVAGKKRKAEEEPIWISDDEEP